MGCSGRAASTSASTSKVPRAADVATDPMTLPLYVSVVERKQAYRALKPKYCEGKAFQVRAAWQHDFCEYRHDGDFGTRGAGAL